MATTEKTVMLVRIYPRNPQMGYHAARFHLQGSGYPMFKVERGWYEVTPSMARKLSKYRNRNNSPGAKPIFQICTPEEARAIERAAIEKERRADASSPNPLPAAIASTHVVDWEDDMGSKDPVQERDKKYVSMAELDRMAAEEEDDDEFEMEDPPKLDLLSELDDDESDLTTRDLKPRKKRSTSKKTAKKKVTKKRTSKKTTQKAKSAAGGK